MHMRHIASFNVIWILSTDFRWMFKYQISWKSVQWKPTWAMRKTEGLTHIRTDRHNEANNRFSQFCGTLSFSLSFPLHAVSFSKSYPLHTVSFSICYPLHAVSFSKSYPLHTVSFSISYPLHTVSFSISYPLHTVSFSISYLFHAVSSHFFHEIFFKVYRILKCDAV